MVRGLRFFLGKRPVGIWLALAALLVYLALFAGQALSLLDWNLALQLHLQENDPRSPNPVEQVLAHIEWGVCAADLFVVLPLLVLAFVGVSCRRLWGVACAYATAATWIYAVGFFTLQRYSLAARGGLVDWGRYGPVVAAFAVMVLVPSTLLALGLGANIDRFVVVRPHSRVIRRKSDGLPPSFLEDFLTCAGQVLVALPQVWIGSRRVWRATRREVERRLAADEFIEGAIHLDRAITIDRPPEKVWPWVARYGRGAGYYSWDFLDNSRHRHSDYLIDVPEPAVGDWNEGLGKIRYMDPGHEIAWYDEPEFFPRIAGGKTPFSLGFRLDPAPGDATRLHFRASLMARPALPARILIRIVILMDHVMSTEMLRRLKVLVETYEERLEAGETNTDLAPHQRAESFRLSTTREESLPWVGMPSP